MCSPPEREGAANDRIEVDDADLDSTYAESTVTDTTSLRSSILQYKWENGRRYLGDGWSENKYWGPNDERQQVAEDLSHQIYTLVSGGLYEAPISNPERVLDVGCGTGAWVIDFADEHPSAEVTGVDISPIQPSFIPPNVRFEVDDINKPWTFPSDYFDYVHIRTMLGTVSDWTQFYKSALNHVKPGGWFEQVEVNITPMSDDDSIPHGGALEKWPVLYDQVGERIGVTFRAAQLAAQSMRQAGLVNVAERIVKVPVGPWPKDKRLKTWGQWFQYFILEGLEGFGLRSFTDVLGWSYEEAQLYLVDVRKETLDPNVHQYSEIRIVYGQKPTQE